MLAIAALALALPAAVRAEGMDPLRCEAIGMRKEGQRYECLGRCERRSDRHAQQGKDSESGLTACQQDCEIRYANAIDQLDQREVCGGGGAGDSPTADPNKCMARLMRAKATKLICQSQCGARAGTREAFDSDACLQQCETHYQSAVERILSKPFCAGQTAPE
jgi:hypothetical protein